MKLLRSAIAVLAIAAIFIAGCAGDDEAEPEATSTTVATDTSTTAAPSTTAPDAPPTPPEPPETVTTTTTEPPETPAPDPNIPIDISAGIRHTCAVMPAGTVYCWGDNENGQLGNGESGTAVYATTPVAAQGIADAVDVAVGWEHSCAAHANGEVSCWGDNSHGEVGSPADMVTVALPTKVSGISDATSVSAGHWHTCALRITGEIACWGADHDGQLGDGRIASDLDSFVPVDVIGISDAVGVSAGGEHSCALHTTGEISCWGDNWQGELGNGEAGNDSDSALAVKVVGISDAVSISSGDWHTCAVRESGKISCWGGDNWQGELGTGQSWGASPDTVSVSPPRVPGEVFGISDAKSVAAGSGYTCAVHQSARMSCWGSNFFGLLATNPVSTFSSPAPLMVEGIDDATAISAGIGHACVLRATGAYCWGRNFNGQLGHGQDSEITFERVKVPGISDAIDVSGAIRHTCAAHASGEVSCWGQTWRGAPGDATAGDVVKPVKVDSINNATSISSDPGITCATLESGEAACWGIFWNNDYVLNADDEVSPVPVKWPIFSANTGTPGASDKATNIARIETGDSHACALHNDGTITCAGANWYGNVGNGEFGSAISWVPAEVVGIDDAVDLSLGFYHSCAVHATGEVSCWGRNEGGQLGNGQDRLESNSPTPVKALGITDAVAVSTTYIQFTCALHETGEVSCWGSNLRGELGNSATVGGEHSPVDHSSVPVKIEGITDAKALSAGATHACVVHESGEVSCWGSNSAGEIGSDEHIVNDQTSVPVKVSGVTDVVAISAAEYHTCAVHENGELTCWGWDEHGQLGDGQAFLDTSSFVPVRVIFDN